MEEHSNEGLWNKIKNFDFESFLDKNKLVIVFFLLGLILVGLGVFYFRNDKLAGSGKIEVLNDATVSQEVNKDLVVEIEGGVEKPGVYNLPGGSRIEDLLIKAGGLSGDADRVWVEKFINRAAKLTDGQKVMVQKLNEQSNTPSAKNTPVYQTTSTSQGSGLENLVNINTATFKELDSLPGIGQVYGQNIIDQRPYSSTQELLSKGVLKQSVYEKIKDLITAY